MVLIRAFREREEAGDLIGVALRYVEEEMEMAEGRLEWVNEEEMKMPVSAPKWMVEEIEYQKETAQRKLRASQAVARWMQWKIALICNHTYPSNLGQLCSPCKENYNKNFEPIARYANGEILWRKKGTGNILKHQKK